MSEIERETREWQKQNPVKAAHYQFGVLLARWLAREALWREYEKLKAKHLSPMTLPKWLRLRDALGIDDEAVAARSKP